MTWNLCEGLLLWPMVWWHSKARSFKEHIVLSLFLSNYKEVKDTHRAVSFYVEFYADLTVSIPKSTIGFSYEILQRETMPGVIGASKRLRPAGTQSKNKQKWRPDTEASSVDILQLCNISIIQLHIFQNPLWIGYVIIKMCEIYQWVLKYSPCFH